MKTADEYEDPTLAAAWLLWRAGHGHPFTCGGGGGPCSGVELELLAANPHAVLMECPNCGRQQFEVEDKPASFVGMLRGFAATHNPEKCFTCMMDRVGSDGSHAGSER